MRVGEVVCARQEERQGMLWEKTAGYGLEGLERENFMETMKEKCLR